MIVAIDFGSYRSFVGHMKSSGPEVFLFSSFKYSTPSLVSYHGSIDFGNAALSFQPRFPRCVIYDMKRMVGLHFADPTLQRWIKWWPFEVSQEGQDGIRINIPTDSAPIQMSPECLIQEVVNDLTRIMCESVHQPILGVVITAPSCFTEPDREHIKTVIQQGYPELPVVDVVENLVAAGLGYVHEFMQLSPSSSSKKILIVDFGAGKLDVGVVQIDNRGEVLVLSRAGNRNLGGRDLDILLASAYLAKVNPDSKIFSQLGPEGRFALLESCRVAKESLSTEMQSEIVLSIRRPRKLQLSPWTITRGEFEKLCQNEFDEVLKSVRTALTVAKVTGRGISDILFLGGSTQIPGLRKQIRARAAKKQHNKETDLIVVQGAIITASRISPPHNRPIITSGMPTGEMPLKMAVPRSIQITAMVSPSRQPDIKELEQQNRLLEARVAQLEAENTRLETENREARRFSRALYIPSETREFGGILGWLAANGKMSVSGAAQTTDFFRNDTQSNSIIMSGERSPSFTVHLRAGTSISVTRFHVAIGRLQRPSECGVLCILFFNVESNGGQSESWDPMDGQSQVVCQPRFIGNVTGVQFEIRTEPKTDQVLIEIKRLEICGTVIWKD
jgi:molecular chaperone DnaK (HSP70)